MIPFLWLTRPPTVPWYVTAFLKLVSPFVDPVTKAKIKYNEPLTDHVPSAQLFRDAGGAVDFEYDHDVYWPALTALAEQRRRERTERWDKSGKPLGVSELFLKGGDVGAGANGAPPPIVEEAKAASQQKTSAQTTDEATTETKDETAKADTRREHQSRSGSRSGCGIDFSALIDIQR